MKGGLRIVASNGEIVRENVSGCASCRHCFEMPGLRPMSYLGEKDKQPIGECRRFPAQVFVTEVEVESGQALMIHHKRPNVGLDDSCGEWSPRVVEVEDALTRSSER